MATYNGRRGPNVSQYLRDLNSVNPQEPAGDEGFSIADDLAIFTNTEFFDMDSGQSFDFQAQPGKPDADATPSAAASEDPSSAVSVVGDMPSLDFMSGDFTFSDFAHPYHGGPSINYADGAQNFPPLQPNHGSVYGGRGPAQQQQARFAQATAASRAPEKRKPEPVPVTPTHPGSLEENARQAAEEDKRRRNTAASARFRVKKKQREQALEKSAKDMTEKVTSLESKVSQLETENKWLKNLLVEKNEGNEDITALWKEFTKHAAKRGKTSKDKADSAKSEA